MDNEFPKNINVFLERFQKFMPTDRRVRMTIQAFMENILEINDVLDKDSVRCSGTNIFLNVNPYLKSELMNHSAEILNLLREKDHLYFTHMR